MPDEINDLVLLHCTPDSFAVGWKPPCDNNMPIKHFSVYLMADGDEEFDSIGDLDVAEVDEDG